MSVVEEIRKELKAKGNPERAKLSARYFKTGPGQYGEGDVFLGLTVPAARSIAKKYSNLTPNQTIQLLRSKIHEDRVAAVVILVGQFQKGDQAKKREIYRLYLKNIAWINNWDLVDISAPKIVGAFLAKKDKKILYDLARSENIWKRRVAVLSTFEFIRQGQHRDSLKIAEMLLSNRHDLIHKAVGWMLREIGKRSLFAEEEFLRKHLEQMPRTMLRYAIEKFPEPKRKKYLKARK